MEIWSSYAMYHGPPNCGRKVGEVVYTYHSLAKEMMAGLEALEGCMKVT